MLKVKVSSPPQDGRANDACLELLAARLEVPKSRIRIVRGFTKRYKVVEIAGLPDEALSDKMHQYIKEKEGISSRKLGADLMLYDETLDKVHILNETGALIWELLNGGNNIPGTEKILLEKYPDTAMEEISKDVNNTIQKLLSEGLITCM